MVSYLLHTKFHHLVDTFYLFGHFDSDIKRKEENNCFDSIWFNIVHRFWNFISKILLSYVYDTKYSFFSLTFYCLKWNPRIYFWLYAWDEQIIHITIEWISHSKIDVNFAFFCCCFKIWRNFFIVCQCSVFTFFTMDSITHYYFVFLFSKYCYTCFVLYIYLNCWRFSHSYLLYYT